MPLEIRELIVKASVNANMFEQETKQDTCSSDDNSQDIDVIVAACVEQVLAILKDRSER